MFRHLVHAHDDVVGVDGAAERGGGQHAAVAHQGAAAEAVRGLDRLPAGGQRALPPRLRSQQTVGDAVDGTVSDTVGHTVGGTVRDTVGHAVDGTVSDTVGHVVGGTGGDTVGDTVGNTVSDTVGDAVGGTVRPQASRGWSFCPLKSVTNRRE
eukprot:833308-Prorocentrum_minimum.AAC.3